jgi:hypothetical protein
MPSPSMLQRCARQTLTLHTSCPSKPKVHALIRSSKGLFAEIDPFLFSFTELLVKIKN